MHPVLKIPEILLLIFDVLDPAVLKDVSLVCSSWAPLALSKKLENSPIQLHKLLSVFVLTVRPLLSTATQASTSQNLSHVQSTPNAFDNFLLFCHKIRKLAIKPPLDLRARELQVLKTYLQGRALLPNLRDIRCQWVGSLGKTAGVVLGGSSRIQTFTGFLMDNSPDNPSPTLTEKWAQLLHDRPSLWRLELHGALPVSPIDFTRFRRLQHLELGGSNTISYEWWIMLSRCQDLHTLSLNAGTETLPTTWSSTVSFPYLKSLTIRSPIGLLLHSTMPLLSMLRMEEHMDSADLRTLTAHLKRHSPCLNALHTALRGIRVDSAFLTDGSIMVSLADLDLRDLSLSGIINPTAIPDDRSTFIIEHWARFLENLTSFTLSTSFQKPRHACVPVATEETLVAILKCAKRLTSLDIKIDEFDARRFVGRLEKEYGSVPELVLRHLTIRQVVGRVPRDGNNGEALLSPLVHPPVTVPLLLKTCDPQQ
ncbi:hypothetical protein FRB99_005951 [Tulasnella sp. 403]|nr:hypothetical protein FRB99_005951 [Tulasnella sp. 403]